MEHRCDNSDSRSQQYAEKNIPSASLSVTSPTCSELGSNLTFRSDGPATNRQSLAGPGAGFAERD